ncbi:hypothetical protein VW29_15255 [Devosia limi DSM 17137]|uniref:Uncharacterized conserved protein n=1 Tax=Devosia limi DSM 17137 TaxID=1121477 RepID=A0A0F5LKM4_9HYPH|nr:exopolysaccharide biosynthesis protein [Devosia limi]KKB82903.1 hypothetical protein VW29_15255 [Devosia limi DSM 17137]SHF50794.1 Uncharacterized conserved protein [Devosia limi DSM 17137]
MTIERELSPVEIQAHALVDMLGEVAARPDPKLTLAGLIELLGVHSHLVVLLVFCVLNMVPGPPGYGGTIAIATFSFALAMVLDKPIRLPKFIGERSLPLKLLTNMLGKLARASTWAGRLSRPRLQMLAGNHARRPVGIFIMFVCVLMMLPIPFINAVPNVGLSIICFSMLNRDGAGVVLGGVVSIVGLLIGALAIYVAVSLGIAATDALYGN